MADVTYTSSETNKNTLITIARASTSGAIADDSTNLANNQLITSGITGAGQYIASCFSITGATACSMNGFAIDFPGTTGTAYYSIWGASADIVSAQNVEFIVLNVLP